MIAPGSSHPKRLRGASGARHCSCTCFAEPIGDFAQPILPRLYRYVACRLHKVHVVELKSGRVQQTKSPVPQWSQSFFMLTLPSTRRLPPGWQLRLQCHQPLGSRQDAQELPLPDPQLGQSHGPQAMAGEGATKCGARKAAGVQDLGTGRNLTAP
jgi:hypothetical protein